MRFRLARRFNDDLGMESDRNSAKEVCDWRLKKKTGGSLYHYRPPNRYHLPTERILTEMKSHFKKAGGYYANTA